MNKSQNAVNYGPGYIASQLFGDYPAQFRQDLVKQNYTEKTIALYLHRIGLLARMMEADGICIRDLDEAQAVAFVARTNWTKNRRTQSISIVRRFVRFLNAHGLGKPALPPTAKERARAELKVDYESYLRRQRGLSESTIFQCWRFADRFMEFPLRTGGRKPLTDYSVRHRQLLAEINKPQATVSGFPGEAEYSVACAPYLRTD